MSNCPAREPTNSKKKKKKKTKTFAITELFPRTFEQGQARLWLTATWAYPAGEASTPISGYFTGSRPSPRPPEMLEVRVDGLPAGATEGGLREYFSRYGEVVRALIARDETSGVPKGYGYVWFAQERYARAAAADAAEEHIILGTKVELTIREPSPVRGKKIFVGGLPIGLTTEEFREYFGEFGVITDAVIITDRGTRRPRGFGFVTFDTAESAGAVLQNPRHRIRDKYVEVKLAIPKEEAPATEQPQGNFLDVYYPGTFFDTSVDLNGFAAAPAPVFPRQFMGFYGHNGMLAGEHRPGVRLMMPWEQYPPLFSDDDYINPANWPRYNGIPNFYGGFNAFVPAVPMRFPGVPGYNGMPARARQPGIRISAPHGLNGGASSSSQEVDQPNQEDGGEAR
ncbi:hypothetical protein MLD38_002030 [Melastoma candidum]|uniref:Uncharacterized protein n=1 Tax=Melastoma candidum TaxID=119954 RepID=A0ACB9SJ50_9MYRT|nr:hypothetical protein MLD38_002030 [Melastoma candidum]